MVLTHFVPSDLSKYGGGVCFYSSNMLNSLSPTILLLVVAVGDSFCFSFFVLSFSRGHIDLLSHLLGATIFSLFENYLLSQGQPYITGFAHYSLPVTLPLPG